jgi:hypothetical protein
MNSLNGYFGTVTVVTAVVTVLIFDVVIPVYVVFICYHGYRVFHSSASLVPTS